MGCGDDRKETGMYRFLLILGASVCWTAAAAAQTRPIQWVSNVNQGVAQAKRVGLPIMFYVTGSSRGDESDLEDAQQAAFRDALVGGIARERFVPVRLVRSTQSKELLTQLGAPTEYGNYLLFVTPEMKSLGTVPPGQVADAKALARQMTAAFRTFRKDLFERELKPTLENKDAKPADTIKALKTIQKLLILEADESVAQLVADAGSNANVRKEAYDTLATLSTPKCAKTLLEAAPQDKLAERALGNCEAGVAEELIATLDSEDFEQFVVAYEALIKICKLDGKKSRGFWSGQNERLINEELDRVEQAAHTTAQRWKARYEPYR
jgi:hypothetical protein